MMNYLSLSSSEKLLLVHNLQVVRQELKKEAQIKKTRKTAKRKDKRIKFESKELEEIFYTKMTPEQQKLIRGK